MEWAKPYLTNKRRILRIMDIRLEGQYSLDQALRAGNLALQCICMEPRLRPTMDDVVKALEQLQGLKDSVKGLQKERHSNRHTRHTEATERTGYPRPSASPLYN